MSISGAFNLGLVVIVLTLLLVTILDTAGTLIGVARQAGFLDAECHLPRLRQALLADSGAAMLGAVLGTSTTTAYIESAAGVEEGGRTGLTALVVAALFLLSLFLAPLAQTVPPYATAPALIFVACLMAASLGAIKWEDPTEYIPALITALLMPLSYSIATGIGLGFIAYCVEGVRGPLPRDQCGGRCHSCGLPAEAALRLTPLLRGPCKTLLRSL
jgi:adenine/guanine/hypoxanthine permease